MKQKIKEMSITKKVLVGLVVGIIVGIITYQLPESGFKNNFLIDGLYQLLGQVFLRGIMMLVVPLVFISLVNGAAGMGDIKKLGRIGVRTIGFYLTTTAIAVVIALLLGHFLKPGIGLNLEAIDVVETTINEPVPLVQILYEIIPKNPIQAMADGDMLQIIIFAIATGIGISVLGDKANLLVKIFDSLNDLVMVLVGLIMKAAPFGVFGLIARTMSTVGAQAVLPLAKYIGVVYIGLFIHMFLVYGIMLKIFTDFSMKKFYRKFAPVMSIAFSTASSSATVPASLEVLESEMGISRDVSSFTIPLGATINMDGTAIMQGVAVFFIAQVYGVPLTMKMIVTVVLTATLASIGTAGVPGAGAIMLSMVLQSVGLPLDGMGLLMGIDRLVDMGRTTTNITGDAVCTAVIASKEGAIKKGVF